MIENLEVSVFKALAHPIRIKIIKKLTNNELCVCKLKEDVEFSQSNLSQHLKILKDAGIVCQRREGLNIMYSIKNMKVLDLLKIVEEMIYKEIKDLNSKIGDR